MDERKLIAKSSWKHPLKNSTQQLACQLWAELDHGTALYHLRLVDDEGRTIHLTSELASDFIPMVNDLSIFVMEQIPELIEQAKVTEKNLHGTAL